MRTNNTKAAVSATLNGQNRLASEPKPILRILAILAILVQTIFTLNACSNGGDDEPSDGIITPAGWTKGLTDFAVQAGEEPGSVKYTFTATDPAADTYVLHYIQGKQTSAVTIIGSGTAREVSLEDMRDDGDYILLQPNTEYSFVIVAKKSGLSDATSAVKTATAKAAPQAPAGGKTVKVNGIPNGIIGIMLLDEDSAMVAMAFNNNGNFALVPLVSDTTFENGVMSISEEPDFTKSWNGSGSFYVALMSDTTGYVYAAADGKWKKFEFTGGTSYTLDFSSFTEDDSLFSSDSGSSCDEDENCTSGGDDPIPPEEGWVKGLSDFAVQKGEEPGEVQYTFTVTDPAADTYTLYYIQGKQTSAASIISSGTAREIDIRDMQYDDNYILLQPNTEYSFVLVAEKSGLKNATSAVKTLTTKAVPQVPSGGKTLKINGIPSSIVMAMLLDNLDEGDAVAMAYNNNGNFAFVPIVIDTTFENGYTNIGWHPDFTKSWNGSGSFYLGLISDDATYVYATANKEMKTFVLTAGVTSYTLDFGDFIEWIGEADNCDEDGNCGGGYDDPKDPNGCVGTDCGGDEGGGSIDAPKYPDGKT